MVDMSKYYPASQAYKQALEDLDVAIEKGTIKPKQTKEFLDTRIKELLEKNLKKMVLISNKNQIIGLVEGALLSFIGGLLASSLFYYVSTKSITSIILCVACGISFFIALGLVLGKIKNFPTT